MNSAIENISGHPDETKQYSNQTTPAALVEKTPVAVAPRQLIEDVPTVSLPAPDPSAII